MMNVASPYIPELCGTPPSLLAVLRCALCWQAMCARSDPIPDMLNYSVPHSQWWPEHAGHESDVVGSNLYVMK